MILMKVCVYIISICLPRSLLFITISIETQQRPPIIKKKMRHTLHRFCVVFSLSHPFFDLIYSQTPLHVLSPDSNKPFLHPPCSNKIVLVKTTNDFYVATSNGQFSVFILFGFPVNFFPLLETLPSLDSWYSNSLGCPLSSFYTNHFFLVFSANSFSPPDL